MISKNVLIVILATLLLGVTILDTYHRNVIKEKNAIIKVLVYDIFRDQLSKPQQTPGALPAEPLKRT